MFFKKLNVEQKNYEYIDLYTNKDLEEKIIKGMYNSMPEFKEADISIDDLKLELISIMLELYSTAFAVYRFNKAIEQSISLRSYLIELGIENYWKGMEPYNNVVSRSAIAGIDKNTPAFRAKATYVDSMRMGLMKDFINKHGKEEAEKTGDAVGRAVNRFGVNRKAMFTGVANEACDRLGVGWLSPKHVEDFYKSAYEFIKS